MLCLFRNLSSAIRRPYQKSFAQGQSQLASPIYDGSGIRATRNSQTAQADVQVVIQ
jgi:hypothetical protein